MKNSQVNFNALKVRPVLIFSSQVSEHSTWKWDHFANKWWEKYKYKPSLWKGLHELRNIFEKLKLCMNFSVSALFPPTKFVESTCNKKLKNKLQCAQSESTFNIPLPSELDRLKIKPLANKWEKDKVTRVSVITTNEGLYFYFSNHLFARDLVFSTGSSHGRRILKVVLL